MLNPMAEAVLLMQRCFWLGHHQRPRGVQGRGLPADLWSRGVITLAPRPGALVIAQVWSQQARARSRSASDDDHLDRGRARLKTFTMRYHRTIKQMAMAEVRGQRPSDRFNAVDDVSFTVQQGESIGLMGLNGSGKSTLLKLISGVMRPDAGAVLTRGRIAGLIATGAGFHPQLSGRENLFLNAAILGMSEAETRGSSTRSSTSPTSASSSTPRSAYYSSGMKARLGFAVAINVDADIFIADEALAVGDQPFKRKCKAKMQRDPRERPHHVLRQPRRRRRAQMCDRVIVLENGRLGFDGDVDEGIRYLHYDEDDDADEDDDLGPTSAHDRHLADRGVRRSPDPEWLRLDRRVDWKLHFVRVSLEPLSRTLVTECETCAAPVIPSPRTGVAVMRP